LGDIARYIGRSSPISAERFCLKLIERIESLDEFPQMGRVVPEKKRETLRELVFPPFRIAYECHPESHLIEILTVWHSARGSLEI
jgi:toxin ParE1/3/4